LHVVGTGCASNYERGVSNFYYNSSICAGGFVGFHARGTEASPTTVANGDYLSGIHLGGHDGTSFITTSYILAKVNGTVATGSIPTDILFETGSTAAGTGEKMRLTSAGRLGIGTSSPSEMLHVVGNICATGTIATCSDLRYKKDINKIDNALSLISKFNGYTYNYKVKEFPENKFDSTAQVGFIAQELQEVLPQVVQKNEAGYLAVDYAKVTPLLLMAIKEQQVIIESLKKNNDAQKSAIDALKVNALKVAELENKMNAMLLLLNKKEEVTAKQ
jgi:hypothetical protein